MRSRLLRYGAIFATAGMFALYARVAMPWALLGWFGLVPWLASLDRERSAAAAARNAVAMSVVFTLGVFAWFGGAVARYTGVSPWISFVCLALAAPFLQPQFVVFALVRHRLAARGAGAPALAAGAASAWVAAEWAFPRLFGDTLGHGLFPFERLRQAADVAGVAGLTFLVLTVNESVLIMLSSIRLHPRRAVAAALAAVALVSLPTVYGSERLRRLENEAAGEQALRAILVQANLGNYDALRDDLGSFAAVRRILSTYERMTQEALAAAAFDGGPDLVVWPEGVYPTTFGAPKSDEGRAFDEEISRFAAEANVSLLFGTYEKVEGREFNAAFLLSPRGAGRETHQKYRKTRLFPLTERVPSWLESDRLREALPWLGTWSPGDGAKVLTVSLKNGGSVKIAPLVCRDAVDPQLAADAARAGAQVLVVLSNDGWFSDTAGARLHLVVSAFRSIETRLPQLRATNTGISAAVTASGEIESSTPADRRAVLAGAAVPGPALASPVLAWGSGWFPVLCMLAAVCLLLAPGPRSRSRRATG